MMQEKLRQARRERGIPEDGNGSTYKREVDGSTASLIDVLYGGTGLAEKLHRKLEERS